jgi:glycosyltransferase involved in cell wall biosynthesis
MHVITGLERGGAEAMLLRLLCGLGRQDFAQSVVSLTGRGSHGDHVEAAGVHLTTLGLSGLAATPRCLARLSAAMREQRPDIVHTWLYHADFFGLVAARLAGCPSVAWNIRCAELRPEDAPGSTHRLISVLARLSARPNAVVFNSYAGLQSHRNISYRPRCSLVIPNGFDLEEWRPDLNRRSNFRAEIGVVEKTFIVGMVARYHRIKDHRSFLKAATRIRSSGADVRFVLTGHGIEWGNQALVADIEAFDLRNNVILLGARNDMPTVMAGLDCLALTSTSEGFPNVIGEAMASGVPCVSTDAGDARLIVGDTGNIVPVGDAIGLADAIIALISTSPAARMSLAARCRARISEKFGLDRVLGLYANFYQNLDEQRKRQTSRK